MPLTRHDQGDGSTVAAGYEPDRGCFVAMTRAESQDFKTERGAIAWLARRGYDANGKRIADGAACASKSERYVDPIFGHVVGVAECAWAFDRLPRDARQCERVAS